MTIHEQGCQRAHQRHVGHDQDADCRGLFQKRIQGKTRVIIGGQKWLFRYPAVEYFGGNRRSLSSTYQRATPDFPGAPGRPGNLPRDQGGRPRSAPSHGPWYASPPRRGASPADTCSALPRQGPRQNELHVGVLYRCHQAIDNRPDRGTTVKNVVQPFDQWHVDAN